MHNIRVVILMLFLPFVHSTCGPSALGSDALGCIEGIASNFGVLNVVGTLKDFVECVLNGTTTQCQYECFVGYLAAGCEGDNYNTCMSEQTRKCWDACDGHINVFNQGCLSAALDVASSVPGIDGIAALAGIFFSCVDVVGCGISWAITSIINVTLTLAQDAKKELCSLLYKLVGQNAALQGIVRLFGC